MDSPGHCAQYLQYTMMEEATIDILWIEFVDKWEAALKSLNMEPLALRRAFTSLLRAGMSIAEVDTDAHVQIPKLFV